MSISSHTPTDFIPGVDMGTYSAALAFLQAQGQQTVSERIFMCAELAGFRLLPGVTKLAERPAAKGIAARPVTSADLPELMPFIRVVALMAPTGSWVQRLSCLPDFVSTPA
ncbi:MAG: hypothetical protein ACUVSS_13270 [Anaerolineae bacterium]